MDAERPSLLPLAALALTAGMALLTGCTSSSVDTSRLDGLLSERVADDQPGCAAAVYFDDRVVWSGVRGLADVQDQLLITDDTVFKIGENTMQFTATAILLLAERGELDLDDPVRSFLPDLPEWGDEVTIDQLLHHTSGIPHYGDFVGELDRKLPRSEVGPEEIIAAIVDRGLVREAGARFSPSGGNYLLLAQVVEAVDGRTLADFLDDEVFAPAGVEAVLTYGDDVPNLAKSYLFAASDNAEPAESGWRSLGDVGIYTTASDLAKWGGQYWDPTVGGEEMLAARMRAVTVQLDDAAEDLTLEYGAGIYILHEGDKPTMIGHGSAVYGFTTDLVVMPDEELAAAVLCNHREHNATETAIELLDAVTSEKD